MVNWNMQTYCVAVVTILLPEPQITTTEIEDLIDLADSLE